MPQHRRRVVSCPTCRRLKTRCEVPIGSAVCSRCKALRIPCQLPLDAQASIGSVSRSPPTLVQACNCEERLAAVEAELAELRLAVHELSQTPTSRALQKTSSNQDTTISVPVVAEVSQETTEDQRDATCLDPPVAPVRVIRKMYTWINGNPETPKDLIELPEPIRAKLDLNGLGLRLIETSRKNIP